MYTLPVTVMKCAFIFNQIDLEIETLILQNNTTQWWKSLNEDVLRFCILKLSGWRRTSRRRMIYMLNMVERMSVRRRNWRQLCNSIKNLTGQWCRFFGFGYMQYLLGNISLVVCPTINISSVFMKGEELKTLSWGFIEVTRLGKIKNYLIFYLVVLDHILIKFRL